MVELSPASAGLFLWPHAVQPTVIRCRWVCLHATGANPRKELSPASAGFFRASVSPPACCATNGAARRWWGGLAAVAFGLWTGGRPHQTVWTNLAPLPGGAFVWAPSPLRRMPCADSAGGATCVIWRASPGQARRAGNALGESRWGLAGLCSPVLTKWLRLRPPGLRAGAPRLPAHAVGSGAVSQPTSATRPTPLGTGAGPCGEIFAVRGPPLDSPPMTQASPAGALTVRGSERRNYEW